MYQEEGTVAEGCGNPEGARLVIRSTEGLDVWEVGMAVACADQGGRS
jgi:hypothetical protein